MTPAQKPDRHGPLWGPVFQKDAVVFRLWAPSAKKVDLLIHGDFLPMRPTTDGWYELRETRAKAGDKYRFRIDGELAVPDPASRFQPEGADGLSELIDPKAFPWTDHNWKPLPWEEVVIYELHVGTFTEGGTYKDLEDKLDYLKSVGVTAIELMPLATFSGARGWGYDGVLHYAPHPAYGRPEDLKHFIDQAHAKGLMVFLDVVYNHFGPEGDFLPRYAEPFFSQKYKTSWGAAINMEGPRPVREFFIENALYWLQEYHIDGLRFDAVHAIFDGSKPHLLFEVAETVRALCPGKHLTLENDKNQSRYIDYDGLEPKYFTAQWNDDIHHAYHVLLTKESGGYYEDFAVEPLGHLARCLTQGFDYQGQRSAAHQNEPRGEKSSDLPPEAFVSFLQNHDQIGNRAFGERLSLLASKEQNALATAMLLLAPHPPMLFMGEEWAARTPFLYFCDFKGKLADAIREGRLNEFKKFPAYDDPAVRSKIPDPTAVETFNKSRIDWTEKDQTECAAHLSFVQRMLELRRQHIIPLVKSGCRKAECDIYNGQSVTVRWTFAAGSLHLLANFSDHVIDNEMPTGATPIWGHTGKHLPAWHSNWYMETARG